MRANFAMTMVLTSTLISGAGSALAAGKSLTYSAPAGFLEPLTFRALLPARSDPNTCERIVGDHRSCARTLTYGGNSAGGLPTFDPPIAPSLPNARVSFVVHGITLTQIKGNAKTIVLKFLTSSPVADVEDDDNHVILDLADGETLGTSGLLVYDAIVFGGCVTFPGFPVTHEVTAADLPPLLEYTGGFHGIDEKTLDALGFYNMKYTLTVTTFNNFVDHVTGVAKYDVSGKVSVQCTGANSL